MQHSTESHKILSWKEPTRMMDDGVAHTGIKPTKSRWHKSHTE